LAPFARSDRLTLVLPDAAALLVLAWAPPDVWQGRTLVVRIADFTPVSPEWRPLAPALGQLTAFAVDRDLAAHAIAVTLTLADPAPLARFAAALAGAIEPLPSRLAEARATIGVETPDPLACAPTQLAIPDPEGGDASDPTVPPWDLIVSLGQVDVPASDGIARVHARPARPLIDLTAHNPIGRPCYRPGRPATVSVAGPEVRVQAGTETVAAPLGRPLTRNNVERLLAHAASLDCSGLSATPDDAVPALSARLTELAATGVILYGVPRPLTAGLDAQLAAMIASRWDCGEALRLEGELRSVRQRRRALTAHSAAARWFAPADPGAPPPLIAAPEVSVVLATKRPANLAAILSQIAAESYPRVEILIGIHGEAEAAGPAQLAEWAGGRPLRAARFAQSATLGEILGRLSAMADGQLIAKMDDDDRYGTHHLADLVMAQTYSRADIVGLALWHRYYVGRDLATAARRRVSERYVRFVPGGTLTITRQALAEVGGWRPVPRSVDRALLERVLRLGGLVYRTHGFGYVYHRHPEGHTWNPDEEAVIAKAGDRWDGYAPVQIEKPGTFDPATCQVFSEARPTQVYTSGGTTPS
jgi:hypothetical protein